MDIIRGDRESIARIDMARHQSRNGMRCLMLAGLLLHMAHVSAQESEFDLYIELVASYTDNLYLAQEGAEESDYVGQVIPGFTFTKNDGWFTTDTAYRMQALFFNSDSELNTVFHQLASDSTIEVAPSLLFVDIDASIDQSVVNPLRSIPTSNIVATENLGDVGIANVNPYLLQQIGSSEAFFRADYTWGIGEYEGFEFDAFSQVDDFTQDVWGVFVGTAARDAGLEWSAAYDNQFIDYETITDYRYERAGLTLGIPVSRTFRLIALGGVESDLIQGRNIGGLDSNYWEAGFRVNAGQRNTLELRAGERFFGKSYFANIELDGRVLDFSASYSENPTTSALDGPGTIVGSFADLEAEEPLDDVGAETELAIVPIRTEAYISKLFRSMLAVQGGRTLFFVEYTNEDRVFLEPVGGLDDQEDGQEILTTGFSYDLGPRTELELNAAFIRYDYVETLSATELQVYTAGVNRQLGAETDMRITLRHAKQTSDIVNNTPGYEENGVDIALVRRF